MRGSEGSFALPCDYFVNYLLLLSGCAAQIDAGGFDALMPHQIDQQRYVVELLQKVLGIAGPERMRIDDLGVQVISAFARCSIT